MKSFIPSPWGWVKLIGSFSVWLATGLSTYSVQAQSSTLQSYLEEINENSSLQLNSIEVAEARNRQAISGVLENPSITGSWSPYRIHTARGTIRSRLGLSQNLPYPGFRRQVRESHSFTVEEHEVRRLALLLDLELEIKIAFDRVFYIQEMSRLIEAFDANLLRFEEAALAQYETGAEQLSPILNIQNERRILELRKQRLLNERHDVEKVLSSVLNREITSSELDNVSERELLIIDPSLDFLDSESGSSQIPELRLANLAIQHSESLLQLSKYESLPRFAVGAEYVDVQSSELSPAMNGRDALSLRVRMRVPIGSNARRLPQERAQLSIQKAEVVRDAEFVAVTEAIRHLSRQLSNLEEQRNMLLVDLIPRAEAVTESAMSAYMTGRMSYLNVLESERSSFNLQVQLLEVNHQYKQTHALLERRLGVSMEVKP